MILRWEEHNSVNSVGLKWNATCITDGLKRILRRISAGIPTSWIGSKVRCFTIIGNRFHGPGSTESPDKDIREISASVS